MIFTSAAYVLFLVVAFLVHWTLPRPLRRASLIGASFVFYCSWRWEFGFLLLGLALFNWAYARWALARVASVGSLTVGIVVNLAPLAYFKYAAFALVNLGSVAQLLGASWTLDVPAVLLPLGISFFTFQGVAYLVDIAGGDAPFDRLDEFLLFKTFWPQLIAGPIVRTGEIRQQILEPRRFDRALFAEGGRRIVWGFFKKMALADRIGGSVDLVFNAVSPSALDVTLAAIGFGLQIYFDFSAYTDIAVGSALAFGYRLPENFNWPYLASSPLEFWRRWHMTLSRWIQDYVFTPLTFASRRHPQAGLLWILVAMAVCGLWHGAAWTFVFWGVWHGLLLLANRTALKSFFASTTEAGLASRTARQLTRTAVTFAAVTLGWILFRAESLAQAWEMVSTLLSVRHGLRLITLGTDAAEFIAMAGGVMFGLGLLRDEGRRVWATISTLGAAARILEPAFYSALVTAALASGQASKAFVYFQF